MLLRRRLIPDLGLLAVDPDEVRAERLTGLREERRLEGPVFAGVNARISRSRSTTSRTATDCTRPAERPDRTLRQSSGLSV